MILFQQVLCLLYIASPGFPGFWPSWLYTVSRSVLSPAADSLFLPRSVPRGAVSYCGTYFPAAQKQRGPSGVPAVCRIHILFTYRSNPGTRPRYLQARSPLALDHDTDDLFIGLFHSVLGETAHVLDGVLHTLLYDAVAAVELLAFDVHIIA